MKFSTIDMHMHTTASDGTDDPKELLDKLHKAGIGTFAITDHDTARGALVMADIVPDDMEFYVGVELSCRSEVKKCHILGYDFDPVSERFMDGILEGTRLRNEKLNRRLAHLEKNFGIVLSREDLRMLRSLQSVGKPHIANILIRMGYCSTIAEGIRDYIDKGYVRGTHPDRISAAYGIETILGGGGIPVWAHPLGGEGEKHLTQDEFERQLECLIGHGIQGLECHYSRYSREEEEMLVKEAEKHGLLISGGSDYHGKNKNIALGTLNAYGRRVDPAELSLLEELRRRHADKNQQ